ncbi:hypothetical protein HPB51_015771 [Rhipicephalus microplus]|uniref:Tick transposon n=1 Tax=Rhipicephalus microplus TaxID=6941 RepID=A0A9J6EGX4_RHIMP|nr:hypothetical protein HPB51_015771 [Rhipicephalus microplus]
MFQDWLRVLVITGAEPFKESRCLYSLKKQAAVSAEFLWCCALVNLTSERKASCVKQGNVFVLGNVMVPDDVKHVQEKGPKFSYEPCIKPQGLLSLVRQVADCCGETEKDRVISEGVECLTRCMSSHRSMDQPLKKISRTLKELQLTLLQTDKEGSFAVLPNTLFREKSQLAMVKNFKDVSFDASKQKQRALQLLEEFNLQNLKARTKKEEKGFFEVFFTVKSHKHDVPFRAIVSEDATWQRHVSHYLQRHLQVLVKDDPFVIRKSEDSLLHQQGLKSGSFNGFRSTLKNFILLCHMKDCCRHFEIGFRNMVNFNSQVKQVFLLMTLLDS